LTTSAERRLRAQLILLLRIENEEISYRQTGLT